MRDIVNDIGRALVDVVVEPVGVDEIRMAAPCDARGLRVVVAGEVVLRNVDG